MISPLETTTISVKSENFHIFKDMWQRLTMHLLCACNEKRLEAPDMMLHIIALTKLIEDQMAYGAKKYAYADGSSNPPTMETTDVITKNFGVGWIFGTCYKYVKRYENLNRERDLLKIITYMYIAWLQLGYHTSRRVTIPYDAYSAMVKQFTKDELPYTAVLSEELLEMANINDTSFPVEEVQRALIYIASVAAVEWITEFASMQTVHDTDTWNECKPAVDVTPILVQVPEQV